MTKPKGESDLWANGIGLSGLWFDEPERVTWDGELEGWYDEVGNFEVTKVGENPQDGIITFAGTRREVQCWTAGAKAAMRLLKEWCDGGLK